MSRTANKGPKVDGWEIPEVFTRNGGKFDPVLYRRLSTMQNTDALVKQEARRYLNQAMEASTRLLTDAHMDEEVEGVTVTIRQQEQLLLNEAAMEVMAKFMECQEAIDRWHGLMVAITEMRRRGG